MLTVVLSKRNLLTLLAKLEDTHSHRTIIKASEPDIHGNWERVAIKVASDEDVYKDRLPGVMKEDVTVREATYVQTA